MKLNALNACFVAAMAAVSTTAEAAELFPKIISGDNSLRLWASQDDSAKRATVTIITCYEQSLVAADPRSRTGWCEAELTVQEAGSLIVVMNMISDGTMPDKAAFALMRPGVTVRTFTADGQRRWSIQVGAHARAAFVGGKVPAQRFAAMIQQRIGLIAEDSIPRAPDMAPQSDEHPASVTLD